MEGYGGELIGHQTNMNNSRFEEMKLVYSSDEMCPTFDVFFFPRRLIQFIDLGNGVRAKKYNISLHLLSLIDREEKLSFYRHGSLTRIDHPSQKNAISFFVMET